jgi:hypothetical protein
LVLFKTLIGTVTAKTAEGVQRILQTGDIVYQDDIIVTGEFGAVEIELTDDSLVDLGRNSEAVLDPDALYLEDNANTDVDAIQQATLGGFAFAEEIEEFDDLLNDTSASDVDLIPVNSAVAANEAGLATGSDAASDSETVPGQLTIAGDTVEYALIGNGQGNNG